MTVFITSPQVQARLDISRATMYRLIKENLLTPYYTAARPASPRFDAAQVDSLLTPRLRESTPA